MQRESIEWCQFYWFDTAAVHLPRILLIGDSIVAGHRQALAERVMEGTAQPNGQWLPPGTFGYNPEVAAPRPDPEGARRLLAEAGFPQGFRLTFHTPNDRYPNDARIAQARNPDRKS